MKKDVWLFMVMLVTGTQFAIAQTANNTPIDFTPAGDFYTGYRQSLVVVDGVTYADGISNYFHKTDPSTFRWTKAIPAAAPGRGIDPNDIKEIKLPDRTAAELLYGDKGANGAIITETKKATDK